MNHLAMLEKIGKTKDYKQNQIIFFEGEIPQNFYILLHGKVRIYKSHDLGVEQTLHIFYPPSFIAEMPSFKGIPYPASAICDEDSEILVLDSAIFKDQLKNPIFCFDFIHSLFHKIKILENYIATYTKPLKERVLEFLIHNKESLPTYSQRKIAQMLNTTPESLSRILKQLKDEEKIQVKKGKITLIN